jgi:hypothetical protein
VSPPGAQVLNGNKGRPDSQNGKIAGNVDINDKEIMAESSFNRQIDTCNMSDHSVHFSDRKDQPTLLSVN